MNKATSLQEAYDLQARARNFWWEAAKDITTTPEEMAEARKILRFYDNEVKRWEAM